MTTLYCAWPSTGSSPLAIFTTADIVCLQVNRERPLILKPFTTRIPGCVETGRVSRNLANEVRNRTSEDRMRIITADLEMQYQIISIEPQKSRHLSEVSPSSGPAAIMVKRSTSSQGPS